MENKAVLNNPDTLLRPAVIISIRYSVLLKDNSQWIISRDQTESNYRAALFDDARLDLHFHLFSKLTLPSIIRQIPTLDPKSFRLFILISDELPVKRKRELMDLIKDIPWAQIKVVPSTAKNISHSSHITEFTRNRGRAERIYAHVRLDDDDALAPDFVERIAQYTTCENVGRVISLGRGIMANFDVGTRTFTEFREMHYPKVAMGLTLIGRCGDEDSPPPHVYSLGKHTKIDLVAPTIIDSRAIAYIRTMHSLSDTQAQNTSGALEKMEIQDVRRLFPFI